MNKMTASYLLVNSMRKNVILALLILLTFGTAKAASSTLGDFNDNLELGPSRVYEGLNHRRFDNIEWKTIAILSEDSGEKNAQPVVVEAKGACSSLSSSTRCVKAPPIIFKTKDLDLEENKKEYTPFPLFLYGKEVGFIKIVVAGEEDLVIKEVEVKSLAPFLTMVKEQYIPKGEYLSNSSQSDYEFSFNDDYQVVVDFPESFLKKREVEEVINEYRRRELMHDIASNVSNVIANYTKSRNLVTSDITINSNTRLNRLLLTTNISTKEETRTKMSLKYEGEKYDYRVGELLTRMYAGMSSGSMKGISITNSNMAEFNSYEALNKSIKIQSKSTVRVFIDGHKTSEEVYEAGTHVFNIPYSRVGREVKVEVENEYNQIQVVEFDSPESRKSNEILFNAGVGQNNLTKEVVGFASLKKADIQAGLAVKKDQINASVLYDKAITEDFFIKGGAEVNVNKGADVGYRVQGSAHTRIDRTRVSLSGFHNKDFKYINSGKDSNLNNRSSLRLNVGHAINDRLNMNLSSGFVDGELKSSVSANYSVIDNGRLMLSYNKSEFSNNDSASLSFHYKIGDVSTSTSYSKDSGITNNIFANLNDSVSVSLTSLDARYQNSSLDVENEYVNLDLNHSKTGYSVSARTSVVAADNVLLFGPQKRDSMVILKTGDIDGEVKVKNCKMRSNEVCSIPARRSRAGQVIVDETNLEYDSQIAPYESTYFLPSHAVKVVNLKTVRKQLFRARIIRSGKPIRNQVGLITGKSLHAEQREHVSEALLNDMFFTDESGEMMMELLPGMYEITIGDDTLGLDVKDSKEYEQDLVDLYM